MINFCVLLFYLYVVKGKINEWMNEWMNVYNEKSSKCCFKNRWCDISFFSLKNDSSTVWRENTFHKMVWNLWSNNWPVQATLESMFKTGKTCIYAASKTYFCKYHCFSTDMVLNTWHCSFHDIPLGVKD